MGLFLLCWWMQLRFLWRYFRLVAFAEVPDTGGDEIPSVAIVVCAKNAKDHLSRHLPALLSQEHPDFEIWVIDDWSDDGTAELVKALQSQHVHLNYYHASEACRNYPGKKKALEEGIRQTNKSVVLLTDADCAPNSPHWAMHMSRGLGKQYELSLGYGAYHVQSGWLNRLIQYDTFYTAIQYFGFALAGFPYMGVGRNLAYTRVIFDRSNGFADHLDHFSGDDDLFVNRVAKRENTRVHPSPEAHTTSIPPQSFRGWVKQKVRHQSAGGRYKEEDLLRLGLLHGSQFFMYILGILLLWEPSWRWWALSLLGLRWIFQWLIYLKIFHRFGIGRKFYFIPCYEIFFNLFNIFLVWKSKTSKGKWM